MANKAVRMINNMEGTDREVIISEQGLVEETATPLKQAKYINSCLEIAEREHINMQKTMRKCGANCISQSTVNKVKIIYTKSETVEEFLEKLNHANIGGKNLHMNDGKIIGIYKKCYCNMPKQIQNMNAKYCECSAGW